MQLLQFWFCRPALFSLVTPGHLLSPHLFLNYRHVVEYLMYVRQTDAQQRTLLSQLWFDTLHLKWGPFFRLRSATKHLGFTFEDPFVFVVHDNAYSVDDDFHTLKHIIRNSYRQFYLNKASQRRQDCSGPLYTIDITLTRAFYLSLMHPIHQSLLRHVLTGSLDHAHRLYKSNLVSSPICPHCNSQNETAEHIFWHCPRWNSIRQGYPILFRLLSLVGTQWPKCFLNCGWVEHTNHFGIPLLLDLGITYTVSNFVHDTHHMFLHTLLSVILLPKYLDPPPLLHHIDLLPHPPLTLLSPHLHRVYSCQFHPFRKCTV